MTTLTERDPSGLASEQFDLIVVGGGIYGAMVALEAVRRGRRPLLLERADFGSATSQNSLRIAHGGLRYLQTADLARFRESVGERRWLLRHFPDLVEPLPCLMPLYGEGLRRGWVMRSALAINDVLSTGGNAGVAREHRLPPSRLLSAAETRSRFPAVDARGLRGGALWYDAWLPNAPRLLIEVLRWACSAGAAVLNYVEARGIVERGGRVEAVRAVDRDTGGELEFRASVVVNAAGPWSARFASACGSERPELFQPSIAWNAVFHRDALSSDALAVTPRRRGGQTYFLLPWKGVVLAGTGHAAWSAGPDDCRPHEALLRGFVDDLNEAVPDAGLGHAEIARVFSGLLPAARSGSSELALRARIVDHAAAGGPAGLYSLSGVKLTTARRVADKLLRRAFPDSFPLPEAAFARPPTEPQPPDCPFRWIPDDGEREWLRGLRGAVEGEAVRHVDDLLLRRSSLGDNPERARRIARRACGLFGWDEERSRREVDALCGTLKSMTAAGAPPLP